MHIILPYPVGFPEAPIAHQPTAQAASYPMKTELGMYSGGGSFQTVTTRSLARQATSIDEFQRTVDATLAKFSNY